MEKYVLSVLVENKTGVLSRVSGLFSRRGYNIDSLTVCATNNPEQSRMTIVVTGDQYILDQIQKQLAKLEEVIAIKKCENSSSVQREMSLIKVRAEASNRGTIIETADIYKARIVDVSLESVIHLELELSSFSMPSRKTFSCLTGCFFCERILRSGSENWRPL